MKAALLKPSSCLIVPLSSGQSLKWIVSANSSYGMQYEREPGRQGSPRANVNAKPRDGVLDYVLG